MNCAIQKEKLTGYYDGELEAAERAEVERHIAGCSECLRELDEIKSASSAIRGLQRHSVPKGVTEGILKALAAPPAAAEPVRMRPQRTAWLGWATSAAAALFIGLNVFYFSTLPKKEQVPPADESPVVMTPKKEEDKTAGLKAPSETKLKEKQNSVPDTKADRKSQDDARKDDAKSDFTELAKKEETRTKKSEPEKSKSTSEGKETPPKKPTGPGEPSFYTVISSDVASARERVEKELKALGISKIETGAREFDREANAQAKDTCIEIEMTEEQIAQLEQRLSRDKKRMLYVRGIQGAEFADEELAKLELGDNRGRFGAKEDAPSSKGGVEKEEKKAEDPGTADSAKPGTDKDGGMPQTGGGGGAAKRKEPSAKKRVVIYFHEFQKKDK